MIVFCSDNGPVGDDGYADEALQKMGVCVWPEAPQKKSCAFLFSLF